jgi:hypothetical protein
MDVVSQGIANHDNLVRPASHIGRRDVEEPSVGLLDAMILREDHRSERARKSTALWVTVAV